MPRFGSNITVTEVDNVLSGNPRIECCAECGFWIGRCVMGQKNKVASSEVCANATPKGDLGL